jgi:DNA-binding response OmpR family regulator
METTPLQQQLTESADMPSMTILVVEDSEGLNRLIQKRLNREGFGTLQAITGTEALAILEEPPVDLILLDYGLPDMTAPFMTRFKPLTLIG